MGGRVGHRFKLLNNVHFAFGPPFGFGAFVANAGDDQAMAGDPKAVVAGDGVAEFEEFVALEFVELFALFAVQVVVLGVAVVVFEDGAAVEGELSQQAGFYEFVEGSIDRRPTDSPSVAPLRQLFQELVGVEMFVMAEDVIDQQAAGLRHSHPTALQVLFKTLERSRGNLDASQCVIAAHGLNRTSVEKGPFWTRDQGEPLVRCTVK